jgi:DnaJ-class molecular chaperone
MIQDFYAILGVAPDADAGQITHAFRCLARALHPDTPAAPASSADADSERFTQVVAAWRVLHDPAKRAAYDRTRPHTAPTSPDRAASDLHECATEHHRDDAALVAGPAIIHARPASHSGPVIRAGPPVRLGD